MMPEASISIAPAEHAAAQRIFFNAEPEAREYLIRVARGTSGSQSIGSMAQVIHGRCYVNFGYFSEAALEQDGRLCKELDGTREYAGCGFEVTYLLAQRTKNHPVLSGATLRLLTPLPGNSSQVLPTFRYFATRPSAVSQGVLESILAAAQFGPIREIAALAVARREDSRGAYELMRAVTQNAVLRKAATGVSERYVASLTETALHPVRRFAGDSALTVLGDPVKILSHDPRAQDTTLTPVLIDPFAVIEGASTDALVSQGAQGMKAIKRLAFLLDGLDESLMPQGSSAMLERIGAKLR